MARTSLAASRAWVHSVGARIAFDLDGTLIDARQRQVGVAREALAWATEEKLDDARFWRAKRAGATTLQALTRLGYGAGTAGNVARRWSQRIEADDWIETDRALPGVMRVLRDLRGAEATIAVLTARRRPDGARRSVEVAGLAALLDDLIVVDPAAAVPAKAQALRAWEAAAFIGDTDSDGEAARNAGVPFAAVVTGQRSRAYLSGRGYDVAGSLSSALDVLARRPG